MKDYRVESDDALVEAVPSVIRQPRAEKFRMSVRRAIKKGPARPVQFNGIHRRRHRKVRF